MGRNKARGETKEGLAGRRVGVDEGRVAHGPARADGCVRELVRRKRARGGSRS